MSAINTTDTVFSKTDGSLRMYVRDGNNFSGAVAPDEFYEIGANGVLVPVKKELANIPMTVITVNTTADLTANGFVPYDVWGYQQLPFGAVAGGYASYKQVTEVTESMVEMRLNTLSIGNAGRVGFGLPHENTFFGFSMDSGWFGSEYVSLTVIRKNGSTVPAGVYGYGVANNLKVEIGNGNAKYSVNGTVMFEEDIVVPTATNQFFSVQSAGMYGGWVAADYVKFGVK